MQTRMEELSAFRSANNLAALDEWLIKHQPLSAEETAEAVDVYQSIFEIWFVDLVSDKFSGDVSDIPLDLLDMLDRIQELDPSKTCFLDRSRCYRQLAEYKTTEAEKIDCFNTAISFVEKQIQKEPDNISVWANLAIAFSERYELTKNFSEKNFEQILAYFEKSLTVYDRESFSALTYATYRLFALQIENPINIFNKYMDLIINKGEKHSAQNNWVLYEWSENLLRGLDFYKENMPIEIFHQSLVQAEKNLLLLIHFQTQQAEKFNNLGHAFSKLDEYQKDAPSAIRLDRLNKALNFFTQGQKLQPLAWTHPVYVADTLLEQIDIFLKTDDKPKAKAAFEQGLIAFEYSKEALDNYNFAQRWGEFIYNFAKYIYAFKNPQLLDAAVEKFLIAKKIGNGFYSSSYQYLAKIALIRNDKEKAIQEVKEYRLALKEKYKHIPEVDQFITDPDLALITDEIKNNLTTWR